MTDHAMFTCTASNAFGQPVSAWAEAREVTSARSYYNLARSYSMPGAAGRKMLSERLPSETHRTIQRPIQWLSRPPRLLGEQPSADAAESLDLTVPVRPAGIPLMMTMCSPNEGTHRPVNTCANSCVRTVATSNPALVFESAVAEEKAKPVLRSPVRNAHPWPGAEIIASPFCAKHARVEQLPPCGQMVLPARRLRNFHASQTRTPLESKEADDSATLWSEAALEANVLAFFGSQDGAMGLAASSSLRTDHKAPVSKESSRTIVGIAEGSLCGFSTSDCIFSAETTVMDKSSASGVLRSHVIDPQAVLSFHRDGARRQREVPKTARDVEFR